MSLALIAALPFLGALLPGLLIRSGRDICALAVGFVTALALLGLLLHVPDVMAGQRVEMRIEWLPQVGLNANFALDGLGLLFAGMILGIGLLIILYTRYYLADRDPMGQFYAYLMLFQGAMLGIVLSDNILLLLVFWELTSLSSYLLIGYWKHLPEGRRGARMALAVTGGGGLALLAGMLILGNVAGSYDITEILTRRETIQNSTWYIPALLLILTGAFAKSAQFPFHFWLPHAMSAPTPVSAYLHSATMVKAGLFLMARLWPVLAGTDVWFYIVATTGLVTMILGAVIAFFKDDLKAVLAYSTVSHLGLITMLLGFGTKAAAVTAVFHIINHATFKAALFMCAGIVDHAADTRDIKRLSGLRTLMPITFVLVAITALSMAGIPPLNGFLSKEMMLDDAAHTVWAGNPWIFPALATLGAAMSVAYALRLIAHVFFGPVRDDYPAPPHDPVFGLWAAPAILAALVVVIGVLPMPVVGPLVEVAAMAVTGMRPQVDLALWHGMGPAVWMSITAVAAGVLLLAWHGTLERGWLAMRRPDAKTLYDGGMARFVGGARGVTNGLHNGALTRYLGMAVLAILGVSVLAWFTGTHVPGTRSLTPVTAVAAVGWLMLMGATVSLLTHHRNRLLALVLIGVVGLMVSVGFAYLSAPDLALTQILVEVATVILLLLALNFLPKRTPIESSHGRRLRDGILATLTGLGVGALIYALMMRNFAFPTIADFHLAMSKVGGGGTNVVNVILVDFRGYDTFGEITVLGIAGLAIFALVEVLLRGGVANDRLLAWKNDQKRAGDRHPLMMVVSTRMILPIALMVGVYIFLRGHNAPGGGFIAGLVVAIATVMQYMASGFGWTSARQRIDYHAMIASGVTIAGLTGAGAWLAGRPFLTSAFGYVAPPLVDKFELATAAIFDLGVFLTVIGAVLLALASISRIAIRAGETVAAKPYDIQIDPDIQDEDVQFPDGVKS